MGEARQECRDSIGEARSGDRPRSPPPLGASSRAAGQTRPPRARSDDRTRSGSDYRARRRAPAELSRPKRRLRVLCSGMMNLDLTDDEAAALVGELDGIIDGDRYLLWSASR